MVTTDDNQPRNSDKSQRILSGKAIVDYMFNFFCAAVLYLLVYYVWFQDGKLCLLVANDKLDGK
jgi:hypothetical protein